MTPSKARFPLPSRRNILLGGAALASLPLLASSPLAQSEETAGESSNKAASAPKPQPAAMYATDRSDWFGFDQVAEKARILSEHDYRPPQMQLGGPFGDIKYDGYRAVRYREDRRLWRDEELGFTVDFFPPGWVYDKPVRMFVVAGPEPKEIPFDATAYDFHPDYFDFPNGRAPVEAGNGQAWTGLRLRHPINRPEVMDEIAVFHGASYFRAVGRDLIYGLSARALAVATGAPEGEEFPAFTQFWLVEPEDGASEVTIYGLLDSPSVSGAFEFVIRPGAETVMDVRSALYPRVTLDKVGIAPLTSMYFFGPKDKAAVDDYRVAVHDSQGLQMLNGLGERIWRPLSNPEQLEFSTFIDENPTGFGLIQRNRRFEQYQDAEARYERRTSAWVEPKGDWGRGGVILVEIPTDTEFNDNIVAFWRPEAPLEEGQSYSYDYRIVWSALPPDLTPLARAISSREGQSVNDPDRRTIVVDFDLGEADLEELIPQATASVGSLEDVRVYALPEPGKARVAMSYLPATGQKAELRLKLTDAEGAAASEIWLYRWGTS